METGLRPTFRNALTLLVVGAWFAWGGGSLSGQTPEVRGSGIRVHGHWTIEVRNADGQIDGRYEFENALTNDGAVSLANLIGLGQDVGSWSIQWQVSTPDGISVYAVAEPPGGDLAVADQGDGTIQITGSMASPRTGDLVGVFTQHYRLAVPGQGPLIFTRRTLDAPVLVQEGQLVEFSVIISFR